MAMDEGGGAVLEDAGWEQVKRNLDSLKGASVKVGVLQGQGAEGAVERGLTMADLAAIHEFGAPAAGIPERSFIRRTVAEKQDQIKAFTVRLAKQTFTPKPISVEKALGLLGAYVATEIKKTITTGAGVPPPLSPVTIARKGSTRPLVDTGRLVGSITWQVVT